MGAVIALLIASLIMMFFGASDFGLLVYSYIAVGIFSLFTMYDVYRIKRTIMEVAYEDESVLERVELIGALGLYLDFIKYFHQSTSRFSVVGNVSFKFVRAHL